MKGSIDMTYRQPTTISLPRVIHAPLRATRRYYPRVIAGVLLGHVAVFAGMTQLQPTIVLPEPAKPIQIRMVELAPPPPPLPKPIPAPKVLPPPAPPKPKVVPVTPPPIVKVAPKPLVTVAPVAKPSPKPVIRKVEPLIEPVVTAVPVARPTPAIPVPMVEPAPVKAAPVPEPVMTPPAPPVEPTNASPRTVAIDGVSYMKPPQVQYPESARRRGDTGTVVVRALIGADGRVDSVAIEQGSGSRVLDQAGLRAVKHARFNPYRENGITQAVYTLIPIAFTLNED